MTPQSDTPAPPRNSLSAWLDHTPGHTLDTPQARLHALRTAIGDSVAAIQAAAAILRAMDEAGDDVRAIPAHLVTLLRRINSNLLLPEVAVQMSGSLRAKVALLPVAEQRRMLDPDTTLEVVLPDGDTARISPQQLTPAQIHQVFGDGYIRERAEQMAVATAPRAGRPRGRAPGSKSVTVNKAAGTVEYYGHTITKATILRWISEL